MRRHLKTLVREVRNSQTTERKYRIPCRLRLLPVGYTWKNSLHLLCNKLGKFNWKAPKPQGNGASETTGSAVKTLKYLKMGWFSKMLAYHPFAVLAVISVLSLISIIVPITIKKLPSFQDPTLGFETRGTPIANRLTAWKNLREEIRPSGSLTANPSQLRIAAKYATSTQRPTEPTAQETTSDQGQKRSRHSKIPKLRRKHKNQSGNRSEPVKTPKDELANDERQIEDEHLHLSFDGFFCSAPTADYSRVVLSSKANEDLLTVSSLHAVCEIDSALRRNPLFSPLCQRSLRKKCCPTWGLHNYVALLQNLSDCSQISVSASFLRIYGRNDIVTLTKLIVAIRTAAFVEQADVESTKNILIQCAQYYHDSQLPSDCLDSPDDICFKLPSQCTKHNAVYNIMHYLVDTGFLPPSNKSLVKLSHTMLFLPIAASSVTQDYFLSLKFEALGFGDVEITAVDFGLKNPLFDFYLVRDTWLIFAGAVAILFCMWLYIGSLFVTTMTMLAVAFSVGIAYFLYTVVFEHRFFPFMNVLACVVAVGIGADDAFIFCKVWESFKTQRNCGISKLVKDTLSHAFVSMLVTSLTTAVAFYASYVSSITAINCFSVFAGTTVVANFFLMVTWLPATVVISEQRRCPQIRWILQSARLRGIWTAAGRVRHVLVTAVEILVVRFPFVWLFSLGSIAVLSVVVVVYYPRLKLPDSPEFQLFTTSHPFEQYDLVFRKQFWFEKVQDHNLNLKLPLRFVWGIKPVDTGNYLDPSVRGNLKLDPSFDIASQAAQQWLLNFCRTLREQPFYEPTLGPLLPNCFVETLVTWMERRCHDPIDRIDRSPCCEKSRFPYSRSVFRNCSTQAVDSLFRTPRIFYDPDLAGPKFSRNLTHPRLRALVVEYDSNVTFSSSYAKMQAFFSEVEGWFQKELESAPLGLRNGWFISDLAFYDLQDTLAGGILITIVLSMALALAVLLAATLNLLVSLFAILTIASAIFVTVGALTVIGWKLNVLECVAVSTAIGLAVDFPLHYGVAYRLASSERTRRNAVKKALAQMAGPTAMAALTTAMAGGFMLFSSVIAYIQVGLFLMIVMAVSWTYATFFLMPLLSVIGPEKDFGQLVVSTYRCCGGRLFFSRRASRKPEAEPEDTRAEPALSLPPRTLHANCSPGETNELDALAQDQVLAQNKTS